MRLLVVDDEEDVGALFKGRFRKELQRGEYDLIFTTDPVYALKLVDASPDLEVLITDLNMPQMNGLELLTEVTKLRRPLKTIVLTAYNDLENVRAAMMRGPSTFKSNRLMWQTCGPRSPRPSRSCANCKPARMRGDRRRS